MTERPLGDVLLRAIPGAFEPGRPERRPWHRERLERVQHAYTGNVAVVNLQVADCVHVRGLDGPSDERDYWEPTDWMRVGWTPA